MPLQQLMHVFARLSLAPAAKTALHLHLQGESCPSRQPWLCCRACLQRMQASWLRWELLWLAHGHDWPSAKRRGRGSGALRRLASLPRKLQLQTERRRKLPAHAQSVKL